MELGLAGLRVMVSAGGAGIGLAIARAFHREGAVVSLCDVDAAALGALAASDPALHAVACDVSDRDAVERWFASAGERLDLAACDDAVAALYQLTPGEKELLAAT